MRGLTRIGLFLGVWLIVLIGFKALAEQKTVTANTPTPHTQATQKPRRCVLHPQYPGVKVCKEHGRLIAYHRQNGGWAYMGPLRPLNLQLPAASP